MATRGSLGDLLARAGIPVADPTVRPTPVGPATSGDAGSAGPRPRGTPHDLDLSGCGKLVLRKERKGRGGKTATILSGLGPALREPVARALKRGLGCGATVDGELIVLQGDCASRAAQWLAARGATRVVQGT